MEEKTTRQPKTGTQRADILNYLKDKGKITSLEACTKFGATRLSAVIFALRKMGYEILSENKTVNTRYGKTNICEYRMENEYEK